MIKKFLVFSFLLFCTVSVSFAQIYRGEAETRNGRVAFAFHFIEYTGYRCLFYIDGVSIFLDEDNIIQLRAVLEKFVEWEEMAETEQISLSRTIDSITFSAFHFNHTFFRDPLILYFVFTGGPIGVAGETTETRYSLFADTTLERIIPFRLSSKTVEEMLFAFSAEQLSEAWEAYLQQKALEEMFQ